ncbi:hypothetical protein BGW42_006744 [Actinomortierella wolfii]|nr:hypothetical protein BGW42_006744 [Actinomortierella wolfii]
MKMLDATGTTRHINGTSDADLFWALRGAGGGSFGQVTEFQIQCCDAPPNVTTLSLAYPIHEYRKVIRTYDIWGKQVTEDLMAIMYMSRSSLTVLINFAGPKQDALLAIRPLLSRSDTISPWLPPNQPEISEGSWYQAAIRWGGPLLENPDPGSQYQYARGRSLLYRELLTDTEMDLLYQFVNNPSNFTAYVLIDLWGGRIDQPQHSLSSAFDIHRGVLYGTQYVTTWAHPKQVPGFTCSECMKWSSSTARKLQAAYKTYPTSMEAYQNYIERDMPNALLAYYGAHLPRLQQIKTNVDPYNVFSFPQSIPPIAE